MSLKRRCFKSPSVRFKCSTAAKMQKGEKNNCVMVHGKRGGWPLIEVYYNRVKWDNSVNTDCERLTASLKVWMHGFCWHPRPSLSARPGNERNRPTCGWKAINLHPVSGLGATAMLNRRFSEFFWLQMAAFHSEMSKVHVMLNEKLCFEEPQSTKVLLSDIFLISLEPLEELPQHLR